METSAERAIAIVGVGAILPDAPNADRFWENLSNGRYSISDVQKDRWDPDVYYDADPQVPDKTYSKIGGWVREWDWEPMKWRLPIPPKVSDAMDGGQKWAIACTRMALADFGYPGRELDLERTAVILGNAMAGELHYWTALRIFEPEFAAALADTETFASLSAAQQQKLLAEAQAALGARLPTISEDTMPGELSNCIAGRIANLFNLRGPNYVVDAACASALAAIDASYEGLVEHEFDAVITGGIDRNMGVNAYVKFCKIGALSATGTRPYADGADGFVMGEGASVFLLKRLADAEAAGDRIYAVIRGVGGSSDGKGKGITAPNPIGQRLAITRAWKNAGVSPASVSLIEGHGTSTRVGDVVEVESLGAVFSAHDLPQGSVPLGSVKSNIGHLKAAAGAAGLLKTTLALHHKQIPPSLSFARPNPNIDFDKSPFRVNTEPCDWHAKGGVRRAGVSAFGFGGTNFHVVVEDFEPGRLKPGGRGASVAVPDATEASGDTSSEAAAGPRAEAIEPPLRGALLVGAATKKGLMQRLTMVLHEAKAGRAPAFHAPDPAELAAEERICIDYGNALELAQKAEKALSALKGDQPAKFKLLRGQGVFRATGAGGKVAFLYTGQGSQYAGMLRQLRDIEPVVAETFAEADEVMTPLIGKPLSSLIFPDPSDDEAVKRAEAELRQTEITQPAVLTTDIAITRAMAKRGLRPDMVLGHSLGEYAALVAAESLTFAHALEAVSARGREMAGISTDDNGWLVAVAGPTEQVEEILKKVDGYVVIANINSHHQSVVGGASAACEQALKLCQEAGLNAMRLNVSHAFHTSIVAPASEPLKQALQRLHMSSPTIPVVADVTGDFYPSGPTVEAEMIDLLARQVASPVQFVKGLETLYAAGARIFVECGPKRALAGMVEDVVGGREGVLPLYTNHPKFHDVVALNRAMCGLFAAGHPRPSDAPMRSVVMASAAAAAPQSSASVTSAGPRPSSTSKGRLQSNSTLSTPARPALPSSSAASNGAGITAFVEEMVERGSRLLGQGGAKKPVVVTGAALGLPGTPHVFDDGNISRILHGEQFIDVIPSRFRRAILDKNITRLVKSESGARFETIEDQDEVIRLAARAREFDLEHEFGISSERMPALGRDTQLAIAAGIDALRDAGIPLVMHYKRTTKGTLLPDRWRLPDAICDEVGIIFASAFPGYDALAQDLSRYHRSRALEQQLELVRDLLSRAEHDPSSQGALTDELTRRAEELQQQIQKEKFSFDRRFLFRILSMGHSQLAEYIGARGPNTQINSACASTTQALAIAEDWIQAGRCRRVLIVSADDVTSDNLLEWIGAGFLSTGAAATDDVVEKAALPFDRRRHGMLLGMGAAAIVVEAAEAAQERGLTPICEVLSAVTANSAYHGTRLNLDHIGQVMERVVSRAERSGGISREEIASQGLFMSHETYTPARGGSASAEVHALRSVFGAHADRLVIANTKGYTGHAMGTGVEDVVAIKALETGLVPPVANHREVDPELGALNLSKGGGYPVRYAVRLGAGFGSQISMSVTRSIDPPGGKRPAPDSLGFAYRVADSSAWQRWLDGVSGNSGAELEVTQRTLRVKDKGAEAYASRQAYQPQRVAPAPLAAAPAPAAVPARAPVAAAPAPAPVAAPAPPPAEPKQDAVLARVLEIVSQQTGYPADMLDPELDLEADLGIDTVKQAETFAAIRESYDIPRDENLKLRDFPTLASVVGFVFSKRPDLKAAAPAAAAPVAAAPAPATAGDTDNAVLAKVLEVVSAQTGYPADMLDPELDLEADLGIDTVKQAETFAAIREAYDIPRDENLKLRDFPTLESVVGFVFSKRPDLKGTPAPAAEAPAEGAAAQDDPILAKVLEVVSAQTGYPADMLDPELDLEADLGIDTVKQAETFAAIREAYDIPRDENLKLRDFPTLGSVVGFVYSKRPDLKGAVAGASAPAAGGAAAEAPAATAGLVQGDEEAMAAVPRREVWVTRRPALEQCLPSAVPLAAGARVLIMLDQGGVGTRLAEQLHERGVECLQIESAPDAETLRGQLEGLLAGGPLHGVYWLPALDAEPLTADSSLQQWREALRVRVKLLAETMRVLYESISASDTFLVAGTRMGGAFGYDEGGAHAPMGGAVSGFVKAYKREHADALVKVVDFEAALAPEGVAGLLQAETLADPGCVEVGYQGETRQSPTLVEVPAAVDEATVTLDGETVYVITGAAGSIVSAITADLARAGGGHFYLLDLAPEPDATNPDLQRFSSDPKGLEREIFERLKASGERATPAIVAKQMAGLERQHAALSALETARAAGGSATYVQVDLRDEGAVKAAIERALDERGKVDVLLHAAGLEISRRLSDKAQSEFDLVFDVKADGWFNLLSALGGAPLKAAVVFSSIAGRFGNQGQTDYSAANDLLCKAMTHFRRVKPETRGVAIDWTAWADIGMASRGSIPKIMAAAGIDMLPPEAGVPIVRRELTRGSSGEVLVAGSLGALGAELHETGGLDPAKVDVSAAGPMVGKVLGMGPIDGLTVETELDPKEQPFLYDHQIDGTPVLPGVMGIEAFVETAKLLQPGMGVLAVEDVSFLAPFKFYRSEPRSLRVQARFFEEADGLVARCQLTGTRALAGRDEPQTTVHFTARVRLGSEEPAPSSVEKRELPGDEGVAASEIYQWYFHGPAYQVLSRAWAAGSEATGEWAAQLPPNHQPEGKATFASPRYIELCFQTAGILERQRSERMALPSHIERVVVTPRENGSGLYAQVESTDDGTFDAKVVDSEGNVHVTLQGYRTIAVPTTAS